MAKAIEEELADYLLSLAKGPWMPRYIADCLTQWRKEYGDRVASKIEAILMNEGRL